MMVCCIFGSLFLASLIALGPPVVVEMYHEHKRGTKTARWLLLALLVNFLWAFWGRE
ncbi:uncharacterized protein ASPGLDRAFT_41265 [Aspergillus glaucus CBS 516.65]|uniref:Uncharacterized protein n=1 Tax=Aspergillus glaucus CBS 516.65 TaxID=1160497 RepID=A0A1L9VZG9_ASPGL|nr:hypothetical protein ASPGLDRAFT_41265 [Aspergillus glaucus CBS 516.65]OJJ89305.1 hypothetical protein ASPGLDRAFT_41265 [Aspergillus glaucus CBS 516.65]